MAVDPTKQAVAELADQASQHPGAVVMLNLLKFAGADGAAHYQRYAAEVQPFLAAVGASVVYAGDVAQRVIGEADRVEWDAVLVVRYPSRTAFLSMISDPGYLKVHEHREAALETAELIATAPWSV